MALSQQPWELSRIQSITESHFDDPNCSLLKAVLVNNASIVAAATEKSDFLGFGDANRNPENDRYFAQIGVEQSRLTFGLNIGINGEFGKLWGLRYQFYALALGAWLTFVWYHAMQVKEANKTFSAVYSGLERVGLKSLAVIFAVILTTFISDHVYQVYQLVRKFRGYPAPSAELMQPMDDIFMVVFGFSVLAVTVVFLGSVEFFWFMICAVGK
ncbi:uncharacterized protein L3040_004281 [Drepanopeziza brunnea f. sp. 'multigermtubi']|uniref:uncharacterized protein n=1 Tax=Drepanopeziza brunnea f. sp. 'multigermtubi' TaxID=698441 RepID=UPI0023A5BD12|nr:hypothetical protein L3040_004281 [Drepanopeziza brunnea f. sp. 'multigermtubi']